jgi:hypothetical protein
MKEMLITIAQTIVDKPDDVNIKEIEGTGTSILELTVAKSDLGKLIGKGGKTASAIRQLVYAASFKYKKRYTIEIQANHEGI